MLGGSSGPFRAARWFSLALSLALVAACGDGKPAASKPGAPTTSAPPATPARAAGKGVRIKIEGPDKKLFATLKPGKQDLHIEPAEGGAIVGSLKDGVRTYQLADGTVLLRAKTDSTHTTFECADGKLKYELKAAGRKVQLTLSGQSGDPYTLLRTANDRIKLMRGKTEIGRVTFDPLKLKARARNPQGVSQFDVSSPRTSDGFALLLLSDLPVQDRLVLLTELYSRGL